MQRARLGGTLRIRTYVEEVRRVHHLLEPQRQERMPPGGLRQKVEPAEGARAVGFENPLDFAEIEKPLLDEGVAQRHGAPGRFEALLKRFVVRGLSEGLKGVEALAVAEALGRNAGRKVPFAENDVHVLLIRAREIHEKAAELLSVARIDRGRRGDEVHVVGIDLKGVEHAAQQERHFRRA